MTSALEHDRPPAADPADGDRLLWDLFYGLLGCPTLLTAHDLGLFERLATDPLSADEVAEAFSLAPRSTRVMLAVLRSAGVLRCDGSRFGLTPAAARFLQAASPTYFGGYLDWIRDNYHVWSAESVRLAYTENAPQAYGGSEMYRMHATGDAAAERFTRAMHARSTAAAEVWPALLDLSGHQVMLDVGGGSGAHCIGAVSRWTHLRATVFDLPTVCPAATRTVGECGLGGRISVCPGDFWRDPFPPADLHFFSSVLQDWPDEACRTLARRSFDALPAGGRIVVHQYLYDDDMGGPFAAAASDLVMLLWTRGRISTAAEVSDLLAGAGFADLEVHPAFGYFSIVSGRKV